MGRMKFEDDLRSRMEKREIKPSDEAWSKLQQRLDNDNEVVVLSSGNRKYYALAAVIAGLAIAMMFIFNNEDQGSIEPELVEEPVEIIPIDKKGMMEQELAEQPSSTEKAESKKPEQTKKVVPNNEVPQIIIKNKQPVAQPETRLAASKGSENNTIQAQQELITPKQDEESRMVNSVLAEVARIKESKGSVTDEELEALLVQAEKKLGLDKPEINEIPDDISATALLESVEEELDQSFRDRVFKALRSGFENVRTAVAERNN